jgi:hypothetical protein
MSSDPALVKLRQKQEAGELSVPWGFTDGLLTYDGRIYILPSSPSLSAILSAAHDGRIYIPPSSPSLSAILSAAHDTSHEGVQKTL